MTKCGVGPKFLWVPVSRMCATVVPHGNCWFSMLCPGGQCLADSMERVQQTAGSALQEQVKAETGRKKRHGFEGRGPAQWACGSMWGQGGVWGW